MIRIISVVSNDIVTDNRVHKIAVSLQAYGYHLTIIGRKLQYSQPLSNRPYTTKRFRLYFNKGPLFYINLNIRLFIHLLRANMEAILSNDLDTLPACWFASVLRRKTLIYDSHELFPEVPELVQRPVVRRVWLLLEWFLLRRVKYALTVSNSIVEHYKKKYKKNFVLVRNLGRFRYDYEFNGLEKDYDKPIILYQGALNYGRGIELAIESMRYIDDAQLWIVGDGDLASELRSCALRMGVSKKVKFLGQVPFEKLWKYTARASLGLSLEEDLGLNYRYALPNKIFDYVQARIPVIVSNLPEMAATVSKYKFGKVLEDRNAKGLASLIHSFIGDEADGSIQSSDIELAARELCWEREEENLISLIRPATVLA